MDRKIDTVCIVDDDDIYQLTASFEIEKTNLVKNIIFFSNGLKAINYFKTEINNVEKLPDVMFLDLNMPIMDGWQFIEEYTLLKPTIQKLMIIYLVSSSVDQRDMDRAEKISAVYGYMVKPIGRQRLVEVFSELLN